MKQDHEYRLPTVSDILREQEIIRSLSEEEKNELFQSAEDILTTTAKITRQTNGSHPRYSIIKIGDQPYVMLERRIFNAPKEEGLYRGKLAFDRDGYEFFIKSIAMPRTTLGLNGYEPNTAAIRKMIDSFRQEATYAYHYGQTTSPEILVRDSGRYTKLYLALRFSGFNAESFIDPRLMAENPIRLSNMQLLRAAAKAIQQAIVVAKNRHVHRDIKLANYLFRLEENDDITVTLTDFEHMKTLATGQENCTTEDSPTSLEYAPPEYQTIRPKKFGAATDIYAALIAAEKILNAFSVNPGTSHVEMQMLQQLSERIQSIKLAINRSIQETGHPTLTKITIEQISANLAYCLEQPRLQQLWDFNMAQLLPEMNEAARKEYRAHSLKYWLLRLKHEWLTTTDTLGILTDVDRLLDHPEKCYEKTFDDIVYRTHNSLEKKKSPIEKLNALQAWYTKAKMWHDAASDKFCLQEVAKAAAFIIYQRNNYSFKEEDGVFQEIFTHHHVPHFGSYLESETYFLQPTHYHLGQHLYIEFFYFLEKHGLDIINHENYKNKWNEVCTEETAQRLQAIPEKYERIGRIFNDSLIDSLLTMMYFDGVLNRMSKIVTKGGERTHSIYLTHEIFVDKFFEKIEEIFFQDTTFFESLFKRLSQEAQTKGINYLDLLKKACPNCLDKPTPYYEKLIMLYFSCNSLLQYMATKHRSNRKLFITQSLFIDYVQKRSLMLFDEEHIAREEDSAAIVLKKVRQKIAENIWQGQGAADYSRQEEYMQIRWSNGDAATITNEIFPNMEQEKDILHLEYHDMSTEQLYQGRPYLFEKNPYSGDFFSVRWTKQAFLNTHLPLLRNNIKKEFKTHYFTWIHILLYPVVLDHGKYYYAWDVDNSEEKNAFWPALCKQVLQHCLKHHTPHCSAKEVFFLLKHSYSRPCFPYTNEPSEGLRAKIWPLIHYLVQKYARISATQPHHQRSDAPHDTTRLIIDNIFEYMAPFEKKDENSLLCVTNYALYLIRSKATLWPQEQEFLGRNWSNVYSCTIYPNEQTWLLQGMESYWQEKITSLAKELNQSIQYRPNGHRFSSSTPNQYLQQCCALQQKLFESFMNQISITLIWNACLPLVYKIEKEVNATNGRAFYRDPETTGELTEQQFHVKYSAVFWKGENHRYISIEQKARIMAQYCDPITQTEFNALISEENRGLRDIYANFLNVYTSLAREIGTCKSQNTHSSVSASR